MTKNVSPDDFTIGWVCALPVELAVAADMMDEKFADLPSYPSDSNTYVFGCIEGHYIVAAYSPTAEKGTSRATIAARQMKSSFPSICLSIFVGIGSRVPRYSNDFDIRLNDVVIDQSLENHDRVVQYNIGEVADGRVVHLRITAPLARTVTAALDRLRANYLRGRTQISEHLSRFQHLPAFSPPASRQDTLSDPNHPQNNTILATTKPALFFGSIVTVPEVTRDGSAHERYDQDFGDALCFETEAAGLSNDFPWVMIRGICDFANEHENEISQSYAAAAAAAYAKELLQILPPVRPIKGQATYNPSHDFSASRDSTKVDPKRWRPFTLANGEPAFDSFIGVDGSDLTGQSNGTTNTLPKPPLNPLKEVYGSRAKSRLLRSRRKSEPKSGVAVGHWGLISMGLKSGGPSVVPLAKRNYPHVDADDDYNDVDELYEQVDLGNKSIKLMKSASPNFTGFQQHVLQLCPSLETANNYLIDRIAHQQVIRYKTLLNARVRHVELGEACPSGSLCSAHGDRSVLPSLIEGMTTIEGVITSSNFPLGIPPPPTQSLPAEFECQLCFRLKKASKPSDWTKHVHEDVQPFTCTWDRCREPKIFKRKADWIRHENEGHRHLEWWTCDVEDCRHTSYRRDNFLQHLVREHRFTEPRHKTKAAIKRAGVDPTWQKVEQCRQETSKRPQEEPCRFCGRRFPSWKKLSVHLAKHMEQISLPILHLVEAQQLKPETITSVQDPPPSLHFSPPEKPPSQHHSVANSLPTDSGYASIPKPGNEKLGVVESVDDPFDDNATVRTDRQELLLPPNQKFAYIQKFADFLHGVIPLDDSREIWLERSLAPLLRTFAIRLGSAETIPETKDISIFVRHYRNRIGARLKQHILNEMYPDGYSSMNSEPDEQNPREKLYDSASLTFQEKVLQWNLTEPEKCEQGERSVDNEASEDSGIDDEPDSLEMDDKVDVLNRNFAAYRETLLTTTAFSWLLAEFEKQARLNSDNATSIETIKGFVRTALSGSKNMPTKTASSVQNADFELHWDPIFFTRQQGYPDFASLHNALTISGSATNAQLLPCLSYLRQCWPLLGEDIMLGLTTILAGGAETFHEKSLYDGTVITFRFSGTNPTISCVGMMDSIIDVAEVLAWLGSALREARSRDKMTYITPHISCASLTGEPIANSNPLQTVQFVMRFEEEDTEYRETRAANGLCWFGLFGNPVIAKGFPVLRRGHDFDGLEIPLPVMEFLADASKLTLFNDQVVLKGFNVALVPSSRSGDIIAWHVVMNKNGERLPYHDDRILKIKTQDDSFSMWNVHGSRHVLGWTPEASCNIGSPNANYHDLWTDPDFVRPGFVLEKFIVQGGPEFLTFGIEIAVGKKDPSPAIKRGKDSYFESLELLENEYIVFYDTDTRQAWLSNGVNALLHLVRASLKENLVGASSRHYTFSDSELRESADPCSSRAAMDVLEDEENLQMPILRPVFRGTGLGSARAESPSLFIDRVNQIRLSLEQLLDFQAQINTPGMPLSFAPRSQLEGYVFMDIATRQRPKPRFVSLRQSKFSGNSWVDFTRTIGAITLFGHGFGNLITPTPGLTGLCDNWRFLPEGKNFLAVSSYDLMNILRKRGPQDARHFKLCTGLFWHKPAELFEDCACKDRLNWGLQRPCDRVQVILPASSLRKLGGTTPPGPLDPRGAVIFGHSSRFPWKLPDKGDIERDNEPEQVQDDADESVAVTEVSSSSIFSPPPSQDASTIPTQDSSLTGITTPLHTEKEDNSQSHQTVQGGPIATVGREVLVKEAYRSIKQRWRTFRDRSGSSGQASGNGKI